MVRVNADNVDVTSGRAVKYSPEVMAKINELTTPYFVRTMYNAMVFAGRGQRHGGYHMELPAKFVKEHGDKFQRFVTLEGPTGEVWKVKLKILLSEIRARVSFADGWREFSLAHMLERGDLLLFSVVMKSKFVVSIFSQAGKLVQRRQSANPTRTDGEVQFPSRTMQFPEDESQSATVPSSSPKQRGRSGATGKKKSNHKASTKLKSDRVRSRKRKAQGGERFSETEVFKLLEEVASGNGSVSRIINGKLVAWEKVEDFSTMSRNACYSPDFAMNVLDPIDLPSAEYSVSSDSEDEPLWPTWFELFGIKQQQD